MRDEYRQAERFFCLPSSFFFLRLVCPRSLTLTLSPEYGGEGIGREACRGMHLEGTVNVC